MPAGFLRRFVNDQVGPREAIVLVAGSIALLAAWGLWQLAPPPPPKRIVMTTGAKDGAYHAYAQRYRDARYGVELELRPSRGRPRIASD